MVSKHPRGNTRERLLEAGCRLFAEAGFDGVTIADLEEAAGLKPGNGSFYGHFRNKEELLEEVIRHETQRLDTIAEQRKKMLQQSLGSTRADLLMQFRMRVMGMEQIQDFMEILAREYRRLGSEQLQALRDRFVEMPNARDSRVLADMAERGDLVKLNPQALAAIVSSALIGSRLIKRYYGLDSIGGVSDDEFCNVLADLLIDSKERQRGHKNQVERNE